MNILDILVQICIFFSGVDQNFMIGLFFPFLLIISATMYAFKTRKCPGGFNETRLNIFMLLFLLYHEELFHVLILFDLTEFIV